MNALRAFLLIPLGICLLTLISCGSKKSITSPVDPPETFSESGKKEIPDRWWKSLGDTRLNQLINQSLNNNFNLKTAWQRLKKARAIANRKSSDLFPSLEGSASGEINRNESTDNENLELGLSATYEVDLWGRINSLADAENFRAKASYFDYQAAAISLSSEVAKTWYQLIEQSQKRQLLKEQIQTNQKVYELIKSRFGSGQIRSADLLRQEKLLESTREQKILVESRIQVLRHQLSVLLGKSPQKKFVARKKNLPDLPALPETGVPAKLVQRRPDVRSEYYALMAADRDLAAAISNQYPRLNLTASLTTSDNNATNLFDDWARSFVGDLTAPLIDAGQRDSEVKRNRAAKKQKLYEYGQSILTAFQEVEDAIIQEKQQNKRLNKLRSQLDLAQETVERLRTQYLNGSGDYIDVLNALTEEQQLQRDLLEARQLVIERRIALYRALAGGFDRKK